MSGSSRLRILFVIFAFSLLGGCAGTAKDTYYWGSYEQLIYDMYVNPGKADPSTQVGELTAAIQQAESRGQPVPPGLYAHLALMYSELGQDEQAKAALIEERKRYPESARFVEGLLERGKGGKL